jgi:hypothetical protein
MIGRVTRDQYIAAVRALITEGERLERLPTMAALRTWIASSDELLRNAWGSMDRYHLSWLMVGRPADAVRGRAMSRDEESAYVREVAAAKTAALRMSLKAVEEDGMPFVGETPTSGSRSGDAAAGRQDGGGTGGGTDRTRDRQGERGRAP